MPVTTSSTNPPLARNNWRPFSSEAELPDPSGGVITLAANASYEFFAPSVATQNIAIFTNRITVPDTSNIRIVGVSQAASLIIYTGTGAFITTSSTFTGVLHLDLISISAPNGTLLDIDGVLPVGFELNPRISLSQFGCFSTANLGTIRTISVNVNTAAFFDFGTGLVFDEVEEVLLSDVRFANGKNEVGAAFVTARNTMRFPTIHACIFETKSNEAAIRVEPGIGAEPFPIVGNSARGAGDLYFIGTSGSIASVDDASSVGTVTVVAGTAAGECIMTDATHGLSKHQEITTSGFSDSAYNGTFEVLEIIDVNNFRIHALFTATDSGSWSSAVIEVTATAPHGLSNTDGVLLTGTTTYNAGYPAFNVAASTFEVNAPFGATSTGSWDTNGLTQTDPRMVVKANAGFADSKAIGGTTVNGNAVATTIGSTDIYQAIDLTGSTLITNAQRFEAVDPTVGSVRYIGLEPLQGMISAVIAAFKSGSVETYRFTISLNGAIPDPAAEPYAPLQIQTAITNTALIFPVSLVTGDIVQPMVRSVGTTNALTVDSLTYITE